MQADFRLTGTQTVENLAKAFAGESQARTRYLFYSEIAKKEGFPTLERIFLETADNERGHAEMFFEYLTGGLEKTVLQPQVLVPVGMSDTAKNLLFAAENENEEWTDLYPSFGRIAEQEGFNDVAESFYCIATVEKQHEARFRHLLGRMRRGMLFQLPYRTIWKCSNCGFHIAGDSAPAKCPACHHDKHFFMTIYDEGYPIERPQ